MCYVFLLQKCLVIIVLKYYFLTINIKPYMHGVLYTLDKKKGLQLVNYKMTSIQHNTRQPDQVGWDYIL